MFANFLLFSPKMLSILHSSNAQRVRRHIIHALQLSPGQKSINFIFIRFYKFKKLNFNFLLVEKIEQYRYAKHGGHIRRSTQRGRNKINLK